ncbi:sigma-70 family RNA polymerase sigma factor [Nakamurella silvestris]|nr:sigma-70 family RNA polymerase sigma factor [Nakamurella silvestris]
MARAIVRLTEGQRALAERMLTEHRAGLWRLALLIAGSRQGAEDLLATAVAQALPYLDRLHTPAPIYLRTVMLKLRASDWQRRRGYADTPYAAVPDGSTGIDEAAVVALRADISHALRVLAPKQRAVIVLRYLEDRSVAEVAEILGCSQVTVRTQAHRALGRLRAEPWLMNAVGDGTNSERLEITP